MKKILSVIIIMISMFVGMQNINAQSINVGYVNSSYVMSNANSSMEINGNGAYAGLDYDYVLGNGLSLVPGLFVEFVNYNIYTNIDANVFYLRVPVHLMYNYRLDNRLELFGTVGPSLVYGLGGKTRYHNGGISYSEDFFEMYDQRFDIPLGLEIGLNMGGAYKFVLGYDFGMLNQQKDSNYRLVRNVFHAGIGYNF